MRHRVAILGFVGVAATSVISSHAWDAAVPPCPGDCDHHGAVTVDELLSVVDLAVGTQQGEVCTAGDIDNDGRITIDEILAAVVNALDGCPRNACGNRVLDDGEDCDDGGFCIGGPLAGSACAFEDDCVEGGACFGGPDDLHECDSDADCRDAHCVRCRPVGGDGCAANCTEESKVIADIVPGVFDFAIPRRDLQIVPGTSGLGLFCSFYYFPIAIQGRAAFTVGRTLNGTTTVAVKAEDFRIDPTFVQFGCFCLRDPEMSTCGGTTFDRDGKPSPHCTDNFPGAISCPDERPCAPVHGPGNSGSGFVQQGPTRYDTEFVQDCNGEPRESPFEPVQRTSSSASEDPTGANALLTMAMAFDMRNGRCDAGAAEAGADGEYCSDDDPTTARGDLMSLPFNTGSATGLILNPGDFEGDQTGPNRVEGAPFRFAADSSLDTTGTSLTAAFTACSVYQLSDIVVPIRLSLSPPKTPGRGDCCQCEDACAAPISGSCGNCDPVLGASCNQVNGHCATMTPTRTPTPTPIPTRTVPTPTLSLKLIANDVHFTASQRVAELKVSVEARGAVAFQNNIIFDNTAVRLTEKGCRLNRILPHSLTTVAHQCGSGHWDACPEGAGDDVTALTIVVTHRTNFAELPTTTIYVCEFELLAPERLPTTFEIRRLFARDNRFRPISTVGVSGQAIFVDD